MKRLLLTTLSILLLASPGFSEEPPLPPLPKAPLYLTSTTPEQLTPEYWINRLPNPDRLVKNAQQLETFNDEIEAMIPQRRNLFKMDKTIAGKSIKDVLEQEYKTVSGRLLYDEQDKKVPKSFFEKEVQPILGIETIPSRITIRWGAAVRATSVRALPTDYRVFEDVGDIEFDQLQFTLIKLWTPAAIYHTSADGKWYYIQSPYVRGWVKSKDMAVFSSREELKKYVKGSDFLTVTGESIQIYQNAELSEKGQRPTMGTYIPVAEKTADSYAVWMPVRGAEGKAGLKKAYVSRKSDVSQGFLPYTQRNVITQAFKLLGARYGWGGTYNGRDCSGFTHDVFLSFGIAMPRDSRQQAYVGTQLGHFKPFEDEAAKKAALRAALPGMTLLRKPLHIMLYLGEVDGKFYIIHSTWAERISMTSDKKNRINQVVVSDLTLNGKSYTGSLFERTESINEIN